jgi:hypothetical protein
MDQGQGHMAHVLRPQSEAAEYFNSTDSQCHAVTQHLSTNILSIYCKPPASACGTASHCDMQCLSSQPFADNAQGVVPANPRRGELNFPTVGSDLNFLTEGIECFHSTLLWTVLSPTVMWLKKPSHSWRYCFKKQLQMSKQLCLCCSTSYSRTDCAQTLQKWSL